MIFKSDHQWRDIHEWLKGEDEGKIEGNEERTPTGIIQP